jgi:hypothetical protein
MSVINKILTNLVGAERAADIGAKVATAPEANTESDQAALSAWYAYRDAPVDSQLRLYMGNKSAVERGRHLQLQAEAAARHAKVRTEKSK